jgi:hypothetical protein
VASALHSEQTLCSNPAVSNIHALFTYYVLSSAKYPEGCRCPRRCHRMTGSPTASCLLRTHAPGGSKRLWHRPLSHLSSWEWRAMLPPISSTSWMTTSGVTALASATWHLATIRPVSVLWRTLRSSRQV